MSRKLLIGWKSELNVEEIRFGISSRIDLARNMKTAARSLTDNDDSFTTRTPTGVQISASECANLALSARVENVQIIDQKLYTLTRGFGYCNVARCLLHLACCTLHVARCLLHLACCTLHVARCLLHVACCTLLVACGVLHVACCTLRVGGYM